MAEEWISRAEVDKTIKSKKNEVLLLTAMLEKKEKQVLDLEREIKEMKEASRTKSRGKFDQSMDSQEETTELQKENEELKRLLFEQEAKTKEVMDEKLELEAKIKTMEQQLREKKSSENEDMEQCEGLEEVSCHREVEVKELVPEKIFMYEEKNNAELENLKLLLKDRDEKILDMENTVSELWESIERLINENDELEAKRLELEHGLALSKQEVEALKNDKVERTEKLMKAANLILENIQEEVDESLDLNKDLPRKSVKKVKACSSTPAPAMAEDIEAPQPSTSTAIQAMNNSQSHPPVMMMSLESILPSPPQLRKRRISRI